MREAGRVGEGCWDSGVVEVDMSQGDLKHICCINGQKKSGGCHIAKIKQNCCNMKLFGVELTKKF